MVEMLRKLWEILQNAVHRKQTRRWLFIGIVVLSLIFILYLLYANWAQLKNQEWHINIVFLVLAVFLYPIGMIPTVLAWHHLLRAFNVILPFPLNLRLYAMSSLPKHIPGLVWYVASRTLLYEEHAVGVSIVLGATAFETALLSLSGFITAILIISLQADLPEHLYVLRYLIPGSLIFLIIIFIWAPGGSKFINKLLKRLWIDIAEIQFHRNELWKCLGWMFIAWAGGGVLLWILVRGITPIEYALVPFMVGIWGLAGAVSLTIGLGIQGLGLREVTLGALLSMVISPVEAIVVAIAFRVALTIGELVWVFLISLMIKDDHSIGKTTTTQSQIE